MPAGRQVHTSLQYDPVPGIMCRTSVVLVHVPPGFLPECLGARCSITWCDQVLPVAGTLDRTATNHFLRVVGILE